MHAPKQELFAPAQALNRDNKGIDRPCEVLREAHGGRALYMARQATHPRFGYLESWLLPQWGLRVSLFHAREGVELDQDAYLDIAIIRRDEAGVWHSTDLYLDLVTHTGDRVDVLDGDEFVTAVREGLLTTAEAEAGLRSLSQALVGLASHEFSIDRWMAAEGLPLTWAESVTFGPVGR